MYKKVSVVLGALALMVAIGFGASQSSAGGPKTWICHMDNDDTGIYYLVQVSAKSVRAHTAHGDFVAEETTDCNA